MNDEYDADNWKADFNTAVSGLHSMVSAQVIKSMQEKISNVMRGASIRIHTRGRTHRLNINVDWARMGKHPRPGKFVLYHDVGTEWRTGCT